MVFDHRGNPIILSSSHGQSRFDWVQSVEQTWNRCQQLDVDLELVQSLQSLWYVLHEFGNVHCGPGIGPGVNGVQVRVALLLQSRSNVRMVLPHFVKPIRYDHVRVRVYGGCHRKIFFSRNLKEILRRDKFFGLMEQAHRLVASPPTPLTAEGGVAYFLNFFFCKVVGGMESKARRKIQQKRASSTLHE